MKVPEKFKTPTLRVALLGGCLLVVPAFLSFAGIHSSVFISANAAEVDDRASQHNSQTIPVLMAANNIDPNPSVGGGDILISGSALMPQGGASNSDADQDRHAGSSQINVYIVREGDTLSDIAEMFDVSVNTIAWGNDIKGRVIKPGQELVILPVTGVQHTVQKGDTIASLAKKYSADVSEIAHFNELAADASLAVGTVITVPDGELPATASKSAPGRAGGPSAAGYYGWPLSGGVITQGIHGYNALDIGASNGTDIYASAGGTVVIARNGGWNGGYGNYVVIKHSNGTQTLYAHASQVVTSAGARVEKGDLIALVGSTGKSTGNHLHFEVRGATNPFK